jgi:proteasome lid subunit RPN8/RPN11
MRTRLMRHRRRPLGQARQAPKLRFSPTAWAKLLYWRDCGSTEVGGFGICPADDLSLLTDIQLVRQRCTPTSVAFDDEAVADFFDRQVDQGRQPAQFGRIWIHTHPGTSPAPSVTDEETFQRVFGRAEWAVMFILARGGRSYARLRFNVGPGGALVIPVETEFTHPFPGSDQPAWQTEYLTHVEGVDALNDRLIALSAHMPGGERPKVENQDWFDGWSCDGLSYDELPQQQEGFLL